MILIYKDKATLDMVWAETPFIGTCHLRGDFPRDEHGIPLEARLTDEPFVHPAISNDGRYAQSYPWGEDEMAEFEAYWLTQFDAGSLQWWTELPDDWRPAGWRDAPLDEEPDGWKAVAMDADR